MRATRFIIISSGYNCADYVSNCIRSIQNQRYVRWKAIFISDGSTDGTASEISKNIRKNSNMIAEIYSDNVGASKRRYDAIKKYSDDPNDVIVLVGLDDELSNDALFKINQEYIAGKWMTYGNWKDQNGEMIPQSFPLTFSDAVHETREYRKVAYRSTAPNTFKRFLFDQLNEDDFKIDGKWFECTTESNLMFSCLEMCGKEKIGIIMEAIYTYNKRGNQMTVQRFGRIEQKRVFDNVVNRDKKTKLIYEC